MGDKPSEPIPAYPDGVAGLTQLGNDLLHAAQADERTRVHDLFASLKMSRPELDWLFGPKAAELAPAYEELMSALIERGGVGLCAMVYEHKYDKVEVTIDDLDHIPFGPLLTDSPAVADAALAKTLVNRPVVYTMLLSKAGVRQATRYNFFFFHDGKWRTGNQLGRVIDKRQRELTDTKPAR
jgi:hypothetical protein